MGTIIGSVINPLTLTPVLWIDSADASTVTTVSGNVSQINDKSGSGYNFTQGTSTFRPSYQTAVQNGLNVMRFDGTDDRLRFGSSALLQSVGGATIYAVRRWSASPTSARWMINISTNNAMNARAGLYGGFPSSGVSGAGGRRFDADSFQGIPSSASVSTSTFEIDTGVFDYANSDLFLYRGPTLEGSTTSFQTSGNTSNTASAASTIGATGTDTQFFAGDIAEIIVYPSVHNAATLALVWGYLRNKWAI